MNWLQQHATYDAKTMPKPLSLIDIRQARHGISLVELLVATALMSLLMVPMFGTLKASLRMNETGAMRQGGSYTRQVALEAISARMLGSTQLLELRDQSLTVLQSSGMKARLSVEQSSSNRDRVCLVWEDGVSKPQVLVDDLYYVSFRETGKPGKYGAADPAGSLIWVDVVTVDPRETEKQWSSTQIWIHPTL